MKTAPGEKLRGLCHLVALSQFCSNTLFTGVQDDVSVANGRPRVLSPIPQRRRITNRLRAEVIEHYERGMSSRRVAATLGLGRTTVLEILKAAGISLRPRGRKY
jgi:DNA invertase Pin-like site-specific DNA recombinase